MITMTLAPAARRDFKEFCHSSQTLSRVVSESASCRFFTGSSIKMRFAGLPVMPDSKPREMIRPIPLLSSSSVARSTPPISMPNRFFPNRRIFSLFRRKNRSAKPSLYDAMMIRASGCFPRYQLGTDSVTVMLFPCCGGVSIKRMSYACPVSVSRNAWIFPDRYCESPVRTHCGPCTRLRYCS